MSAYIEVLSRAECLRLLPTVPVGWIAYCRASGPELVVVNFEVQEDRIVARTGYGNKLAAAAHGVPMAFGVTATDTAAHTGWSVTITGSGQLLGDEDNLTDLDMPTFESWAPGDKEFYIAINIRDVSGRRIQRLEAQPRTTPTI